MERSIVEYMAIGPEVLEIYADGGEHVIMVYSDAESAEEMACTLNRRLIEEQEEDCRI